MAAGGRIQAAAAAASARVKEIDPNWQPRASVSETMDGAIAARRAEATEAREKCAELGRRPPKELIAVYRNANNARDLFGRRVWNESAGTVAAANADRTPVAGMDSRAPGYTDRDRAEAQRKADVLVEKYPKILQSGNLGQKRNDSLCHAEATMLLRAARNNGGTLAGRNIEVHVDRSLCGSCGRVPPFLSRELGNPTVTFDGPRGIRQTLRNGAWEE